MQNWNLGDEGNRKHVRNEEYAEVDQCVFKWLKHVHDCNFPLIGPMIMLRQKNSQKT